MTTNAGSSLFCGTDLGFVFQHGTGPSAKLEVLFGDSWEWWDAFSCTTRGLLGISDDSQGWMTVSRPPSLPLNAAAIPPTGISTCAASMLNMDVGTSLWWPPFNTYTSIRLWPATGSTELELPPGSTPTAGFSDGVNVWAMFKQGSPEPGSTLLAVRDSTVRTNYKVRENLGPNTNYKFFNPSATRIASYNTANPKLSNFSLPTGTDAGIVLFFGRPRFWSTDAQSSTTNGMYLMRQDTRLNATGASGWKPVYFKGLDPNTENPIWSNPDDADGANDLDEAQPMITGRLQDRESDGREVGAGARKWVMLYGGDVHWSTPPPTNDQPRHGAIHMRYGELSVGSMDASDPAVVARVDAGLLRVRRHADDDTCGLRPVYV